VLGSDHPGIVASRDNLAEAYRAPGRAAEAIRLHEQPLAHRERVLGPDNPDTLRARNNLAAANREGARARGEIGRPAAVSGVLYLRRWL